MTTDPSARGTLYVVATPIGNLEDITLRALRVLKEVDLIAAEDTRHSRKLCSHFGISTPLTSYYQHNEARKGQRILAALQEGQSVALISDAGTPAISDPGFDLVRRCREEGLPVVAVPGASAFVAALSVAGLPTDSFVFEGFLPAKTKARRDVFRALRSQRRTAVFYESPHRLAAALRDLQGELGAERRVAVARELTKMHEELFRGPVAEAIAHFGRGRVRGEIVLLVAPVSEKEAGDRQHRADSLEEMLRRLAAEGLPPRQAVKRAAREFGLPRDEVYRIWVAMQWEGEGSR